MSDAIAANFADIQPRTAELERASPRSPLTAAPAPSSPPLAKIIVAIHGIGSQRRSDTIRSVARRFGERLAPPLPAIPLGHFHLGAAGDVRVSRLDAPPQSPLEQIGFAEVFWADIPQQVVKADDTLDETKAWGTSVVSRAQAMYSFKVAGQRQLNSQDFALGTAVIEEIVETVDVLENLLTVTEKMGIFKFDLGPLLRDYIGDVQLVTDFRYYRKKIVARFHSAMAQVVDRYQQEYPGASLPEIYIVAHSEGTVVSFLGLLEALSGGQISDPDTGKEIPSGWIGCVRGYMTIGSPIDKHLLLWPRIWDGLDLESRLDAKGQVLFGAEGKERLCLPGRIAWRNYYDYGDPIGFKLDTTVEFLAQSGCKAFDFESDDRRDDFGFSRYMLPGKAHNDYWDDEVVFQHFIDDVVMPTKDKPPPPPDKWGYDRVSTAIPYLCALALHIAAVFLLYKGVTAFFSDTEPDQQSTLGVLRNVLLLGLLLAGITVAGRLPRLVNTKGNSWRWHWLAFATFVVFAAPSWSFLPPEIFRFLVGDLTEGKGTFETKWTLMVLCAVVALSPWLVRQRPVAARHVLIVFGASAVLFMMLLRMSGNTTEHPVWPVALAGAAFLYLWWLGILLFDLAFIWHRYIRRAVAVKTLNQWHKGRDAQPEPLFSKKAAATK